MRARLCRGGAGGAGVASGRPLCLTGTGKAGPGGRVTEENKAAAGRPGWRGFLKDYPNLLDLVERLQARPAYKRALEKGGPYAFA